MTSTASQCVGVLQAGTLTTWRKSLVYQRFSMRLPWAQQLVRNSFRLTKLEGLKASIGLGRHHSDRSSWASRRRGLWRSVALDALRSGARNLLSRRACHAPSINSKLLDGLSASGSAFSDHSVGRIQLDPVCSVEPLDYRHPQPGFSFSLCELARADPA